MVTYTAISAVGAWPRAGDGKTPVILTLCFHKGIPSWFVGSRFVECNTYPFAVNNVGTSGVIDVPWCKGR
jgi:hypothetical protein